MSKRQFIMLLGVWVIFFLFLGFPSAWDKLFAIVTGLLIVILAYQIRPKTKDVKNQNTPFVEHKSDNPASNEYPSNSESSITSQNQDMSQ